MPAVTVNGGLIGALIISFVFGFLAGAIGLLFGLDEDDSYYGALVRTLASRRPDVIRTDAPGPRRHPARRPVPRRAVALAARRPGAGDGAAGSGRAPTAWATGTRCCPRRPRPARRASCTATTTASPTSAGGRRRPGGCWSPTTPRTRPIIERRISNGEGLLSPGGASISNIFTGDGDRAFLVMSTIKVKERGLGDSDAFAWFFVSPYNYITMIGKYLAEVVKENIQSRRQARAGIVPRMHRGFPYPWVRAATNVALRALGTSLVIQEMLRGTPVIYMDYTDYDEIAHHSGPERPESLDALDGVDRELKTLLKAAEDAAAAVSLRDPRRPRPEPRRDLPAALRRDPPGRRPVAHGRQGVGRRGDGADRGLGPAEHVPGRGVQDQGRHRLAGARRDPQRAARTAQSDMGPADAQFTPAGATAAPVEGQPGADAKDADKAAVDKAAEAADLIVVAGGNLALIYFNASKERHDARGDRRALSRPGRGARQPSRASAS